jgi:hypothetical protein
LRNTPEHVRQKLRTPYSQFVYLLRLSKIVSAHESIDLALPFADFEEYNGGLDASKNLVAINDGRAATKTRSTMLTVTAVKMWSSGFHGPLEYRI